MSIHSTVIMLRHAQSTWNAQSRFTGWADPPLTAKGVDEAKHAAVLIKNSGIQFDRAYTSYLQRAKHTAELVLEGSSQTEVPLISDWHLNERHYGQLQGLNKIEMAESVGEQQVWRWRRGFRDKPEALTLDDPRHPRFDNKYQDCVESVPSVESLADTQERVLVFWREHVEAAIRNGEKLLISSHGNTLRALIMYLSGMSEKDVEQFEIPTGVPIKYNFDEDANALAWRYMSENRLEHV